MGKYNHFRIILLLLAGLVFSGCVRSERILSQEYPIGSIWQVAVDDNTEADWQSASATAREQHTGYALANDHLVEITIQDAVASEGSQQDDLQVAIRNMVEEDQVVAVIGATTNQATTRVASLVNFFKVPMIIPSTDGDNLLPSTNLWAFRLSAPSSSYANHIFGTILTKVNTGVKIDDEANSSLRIAILYEQNTFGESAAVATARAAMQQEMEIGVYASFSPENPDPEHMANLIDLATENKVHLAYLISSDPAVAKTLVQVFHNRVYKDFMPVLVGQAGGFASIEFLESDTAAGVYVLRQQIQAGECPAEINSVYAAQSYVAVYLVEKAIQQINAIPTEKEFSVLSLDQGAQLPAFREQLRDILKQINLNTPCLGRVAFDNTGQNKHLQFEMIVNQDGQVSIISSDDFLLAVKQRSALETSQ